MGDKRCARQDWEERLMQNNLQKRWGSCANSQKDEPAAYTRHSRSVTLPAPESVTATPAQSVYSNTLSGRNNCNMPGKNIRLAEESKRCLFMYGREKRSRWCSRLLSHFLAKLGISLLCAERKGARGGCEKVCGPHPGRSQASIKEGSVLVTVAYILFWVSLFFFLFVINNELKRWLHQ